MSNYNEERKYQNRMEHGESKLWNIINFKFVFIEFTLINVRNQLNEETLSLRKNRYKQDLLYRHHIFENEKSKHLVCPFKLNGIPEYTLEKFRIKDNDLNNSILKALEYLNSDNIDNIKFGSFLFRKYFENKIREDENQDNEEDKVIFYIDNFIDNGIIYYFGKILLSQSNSNIIYELTSSLIALTYFGTRKNGFKYIKDFLSDIYKQVYYKIVKMNDNDIIINLYNFFINCIIESDDFAINLFKDEDFIRLCIMKYLEPAKSFSKEVIIKRSGLGFFASLMKISNIFNEKHKNTFYKIFEKIICLSHDSETLSNGIIGLKILFLEETLEKKTIFNIIKNNQYTLFDKMFSALNELIRIDNNFYGIDGITFNILAIVKHFISLSDENDIIFLLQKTKLLDFIDTFYTKIYFQNVKNIIFETLLLISLQPSNVVIHMIKGHENLMKNIIIKSLYSKNYNIRAKAMEIIYNNLNLISLDINIELFKLGVIEQLISNNLMTEEDSKCLYFILNGILLFINSIIPLKAQWKFEIVDNMIKLGITNGLENNINRFNEEHYIIIKQIKSEINNIMNIVDHSNENKFPNTSVLNDQKGIENRNMYNPFYNNENNINSFALFQNIGNAWIKVSYI